MDGIWYGLGIFLGIVCGAVVTELLGWWRQRANRTDLRKRVRYELEALQKTCVEWSAVVQRLETAVLANNAPQFVGFIDFSKTPLGAIRRSLEDGSLYEHFTIEI
jgi:hypothetical protein